ncbi:MAG: hypothetical protein JXR78_00575 [Victivallales bacterium]|nr:hypothetical protein [Victivallales bacterium]
MQELQEQRRPSSIKRRRLKKLSIIFAGSVAMLLILYFILTSSVVLKSIVLPMAGKQLGAPVHAQDINFSLFSSTLEIKYLTVGDSAAPLLSSRRAYVKCAFLSLPGSIIIDTLELDNTSVKLHRSADGKWNLPLLNISKESDVPAAKTPAPADAETKPVSAKPSPPPHIEIKKLVISKLSVGIQDQLGGKTENFQLDDFNLNISNIVPSGNAKVEFDGKLELKQGDLLLEDGQFAGTGLIDLSKELMPELFKLKQSLTISRGYALGQALDRTRLDNVVEFTFDGNNFNIREISLNEYKADKLSAQMDFDASGTVEPLDIKFQLNAPLIPEAFLDMVEFLSGASGLGYAQLDIAGRLGWSNQTLSAVASVDLKHHEAGKEEVLIPEFQFSLNEDVKLDMKNKTMSIKALKAELSEEESRGIKLSLSKPFSYNWSEPDKAPDVYPSINLTLNQLRLVYLNLLRRRSGISFNSGMISGTANTVFNAQNNSITLKNMFAGRDINFGAPGYKTGGLSFDQSAMVKIQNMKTLEVSPLFFSLKQNDAVLAELRLNSVMDMKSQVASFDLILSQVCGSVFDMLPQVVKDLDILKNMFKNLSPFTLDVKSSGSMALKQGALILKQVDVSLNRPEQGSLKVDFLKPWELDLSGAGTVLKQPMNAQVNLDNMDVRFVNSFLPPSQVFRAGRVTTRLNTSLDIMKAVLKTTGTISIDSLTMTSGAIALNNISLAADTDITMKDWMELDLKRFKSLLGSGSARAAELDCSGRFDFNNGTIRLQSKLGFLDENAVKIFMPDFPIRFKTAGAVTFVMNPGYSVPLIKCDLNTTDVITPEINAPLQGKLNIDICPQEHKLQINAIECGIMQQDSLVAHLLARGEVAIPLKSGKTILTLNSKAMDLKLLEELLKSSPSSADKAPKIASSPSPAGTSPNPPRESSTSEPGAIDVKADIELKLDLKKISYGPDITMSCTDSTIILRRNFFSADPLKLTINGTPVNISLQMDPGQPDGYPFELAANFKAMHVGPIFRTLASDTSINASGKVDDFDLKLKGKGFTMPNLEKNLNGRLKLNASAMSFPDSLKSFKPVRVILIPVEAMAQILTHLPQMGRDARRSFEAARDVYTNVNNLYLEKGEVDLLIANGRTSITKFDFRGDFIREMNFSGYVSINPDAPMQLVSMLDIYFVKVPLNIHGTLNEPEPDTGRMIASFISSNIMNIVNPSSVKNIIKDSAEETGSILKQAGQILREGITGPQPKQKDQETTQDKQKRNTDLIRDILNF